MVDDPSERGEGSFSIERYIDLVDHVRAQRMQISDYRKRTQEQLIGDLNAAWDRIKQGERREREKDAKISKLERRIKRQTIVNRIYGTLIVSALGSAIVALVKTLLHVH